MKEGARFMIFYKTYPYAPKASLMSVACVIGEFALFLVACLFGGRFVQQTSPGYYKPLPLILAIVFLALVAVLYFYVYRKLVPACARTEGEENVRTKPRFAALYCQNNQDEYERIRELNPEFAQTYEKNERGRIVKIKNK